MAPLAFVQLGLLAGLSHLSGCSAVQLGHFHLSGYHLSLDLADHYSPCAAVQLSLDLQGYVQLGPSHQLTFSGGFGHVPGYLFV